MAKNKGSSRKGLMLVVLLLVLALGAGGANLYVLWSQSGKIQASEPEDMPAAEPVPAPPHYVALEPFTVNLQSSQYDDRLLYVVITLGVADEQSKQQVEDYRPHLRSRLLMLLGEQEDEALLASGGRQALADKVLALFDEPFAERLAAPQVKEVLFTEFVIQ